MLGVHLGEAGGRAEKGIWGQTLRALYMVSERFWILACK